ncbi:MAG: 50S ribosomal protein L29 [Anaerolineales bacterium]
MRIVEIRDMSTEDILSTLNDVREELMRLRFQITTGELVDHNQLKYARQNIARLMTVLRERQLNEQTEGEV